MDLWGAWTNFILAMIASCVFMVLIFLLGVPASIMVWIHLIVSICLLIVGGGLAYVAIDEHKRKRMRKETGLRGQVK